MNVGLDFPSVLVAARAGAEWAWTKIYRDLAPSVLRYFRCYSANNAEDLLGEVFLQVVRDLPQFNGGEDEFRAWVFTIARRRLIDQWRRDGRRLEDPRSNDMPLLDPHPHEVENKALALLSEHRVRTLLARLTPSQRDVLFLRIVAGLSLAETADILGNTTGAVKSLQLRGLEAVRRISPEEAVS